MELVRDTGIEPVGAHSFIYVPPGVHVDIPLQAYFRINTENMGQFERTLIIVDEGGYVHYVEGWTAIYKSDSLHSAVVDIIVKPGGRCRYTAIQNWSNNVYNLVDTISRSDTYPYVDICEDDVTMGHEATVSKVSENQPFYLMSRGLTEDEAMAMVVRGFVEPIAKELPMEYALVLNRLIELQMEGAVG
jgi:Fe-S cluster assembly scaffold protein SufB